jgi:hypothetical protein
MSVEVGKRVRVWIRIIGRWSEVAMRIERGLDGAWKTYCTL